MTDEDDLPLHPAIRFDDGRVVWLDQSGFRDKRLRLLDGHGHAYGSESSAGDVACEQCGESLIHHGVLFVGGVRCEFCCTIYPVYWLLHEDAQPAEKLP